MLKELEDKLFILQIKLRMLKNNFKSEKPGSLVFVYGTFYNIIEIKEKLNKCLNYIILKGKFNLLIRV